MKIELHMIQNFAPSCLNRDETNAPKDCVFAGVRRARISSQCIKRAVRRSFRDDGLLPAGNLAWRTKRLAEEVAGRLARAGREAELAQAAATTALGGLGFGLDDAGRTQYLLFLGESGIQALADLCEQHWDRLAEVAAKIREAEGEGSDRSAREAKKAARDAVPDELRKAMGPVLDGTRAADLALFGRMLADLPDENIDAACQVAHAISTHKIEMEMDFYTAVDDLKTREEEPGAGMMGVIGYNSACFYRYAVLDWEQLLANLGGDRDLAEKSVQAFLRASALALPTGKQNTFAAHSRPDLILVLARRAGAPLSLANAFARPALPHDGKDLTQASVDQLVGYWNRVTAVYGDDQQLAVYGDKQELKGAFFCATTPPTKPPTGWQDTSTLDGLVLEVTNLLPREGGS
jgi:CRISPR system Cascade subunit CasC